MYNSGGYVEFLHASGNLQQILFYFYSIGLITSALLSHVLRSTLMKCVLLLVTEQGKLSCGMCTLFIVPQIISLSTSVHCTTRELFSFFFFLIRQGLDHPGSPVTVQLHWHAHALSDLVFTSDGQLCLPFVNMFLKFFSFQH